MISHKIERLIEYLVEYILILLLFFMTAVTFYQVFGRYVLNSTPYWSEQSVLLMLNYLVFLGAPLLYKYKQHIGFQYFADKLPAPFQKTILILREILVAGFSLAMIFYSYSLLLKVKTHIIMTMAISQAFSYIPIALAGFAIVLLCFRNIKEVLWKS